MAEETFVSGETEVKLTGRRAVRDLPGGKKMELVEITPLSEYDGNWKKFVQRTSLLQIIDDNKK